MMRSIMLFILLLVGFTSPVSAGNPHSAYYSPETDKLLWFIHASDISGHQDPPTRRISNG
jgi:hypothetical protein